MVGDKIKDGMREVKHYSGEETAVTVLADSSYINYLAVELIKAEATSINHP